MAHGLMPELTQGCESLALHPGPRHGQGERRQAEREGRRQAGREGWRQHPPSPPLTHHPGTRQNSYPFPAAQEWNESEFQRR